MLHGWCLWNWAVDAMTGGGRCQKRRKSMAGGRGAAEGKKIERNIEIPNLEDKITEKPLGPPKITKVPPHSTAELDLYTQACKALSFRSPFDSEDPQAPSAFICSANTLPSGVSHLLSRHSDSRKRQKRLHSGSDKKSTAPGGPRASNIWVETEEYFRELNAEDVERLEKVSSAGFLCKEKCFFIPLVNNDDNVCDQLACASVETTGNRTPAINGAIVQEGNSLHSMDVDDEVEKKELETIEQSNSERKPSSDKNATFFSGVEWLLGSRSKIYLATERSSKKRKRLGRDAGLEKLLVARPVEGLESVCHYCSYGDMGDPLNCLIKCCSCLMVVHQRCYGVQEDVDASWLCSWCKWKGVIDLNTETPCLICPKRGGALKPVKRSGFGTGNEGSKVEFAHLICCQWMPELYLENTRTMEPIMNMDELKDTKRKLICSLCKVKWGACVRCSNGSCRTSFHPICAREARQRMEIWGKLGSDEVELRAFCSKHSEVQCDSGSQDTGDVPLTADMDLSKQNDVTLDGEESIDCTRKFETHHENGDALNQPTKFSADGNNTDVNSCTTSDFMILKKLIDQGKVNHKDLAIEIGVSPDSLDAILSDNHMDPELRRKLQRCLETHADIGNSQKLLKVKLRSDTAGAAEDVGAGSVEESSISDAVSVKSVPPRRRTKSSIKALKEDKTEESPEEDLNEPLQDPQEILIDSEKNQDHSAKNPIKIKDDLTGPAARLPEDGLIGDAEKYQQMTTCSFLLTYEEVKRASYIHPFIYRKLLEIKNEALEETASYSSSVWRDREASQLEATSGDQTARCDGVNIDQLGKARNLGVLKLSPVDEVEGALIYYQQKLINNAVARKRISDGLMSKIVRSLPEEVDTARKRKWDAVLVSQYNHELREAKKQGRKERRHKEAQAVLAAATAAAAASSRMSSIRKDNIEESSQEMNPRVRENFSRSAAARSSSEMKSGSTHLASAFSSDQPRTCDVCRRSETVLNPILICSSCKVAVHLDCYRSVRSTNGPWHCELCEDLLASQSLGAVGTNSWEKPYFVAECGLCGGTAGAFRKAADGQWIHALCAEWVLESTYRRGQVSPIEGMDNVRSGFDTCTVCRRKQGVCLKCSYGHCQTAFHPTCARSAGFYMTTRTNGGKLQHKAYCEKHSVEQRAKVETQKHGIEEFKSLKQVRVELERLRLLCERIIKREKLKREVVLCSQGILTASRDSVLSALARHPFYQPEVSSESATTSIKGYTDDYKSGSEIVQRSDDITVDSAVAGKRRVRIPLPVENDQKTEDSSTSQNLYTLKPPLERPSFSGKQIPQRAIALRSPPDNMEKQKHRKQAETFEKELIMTSDQASMKNQRLPKGFVYVPIRSLCKDKETTGSEPRSQEPKERNG